MYIDLFFSTVYGPRIRFQVSGVRCQVSGKEDATAFSKHRNLKPHIQNGIINRIKVMGTVVETFYRHQW
jgi:hypothetical protein